jgi:hypothetical protein
MSLSTSFALAQAVNEAMTDDSVRLPALLLQQTYQQMNPDEFLEALFQFSANLTAVTAGLVTHVFMTEAEVEAMIAEANALSDLGNTIENE